MVVAITPYDPVRVTEPDKDGTRYWVGRWAVTNANDVDAWLYASGLMPLFTYDGVVMIDEIRIIYDAQTSGPNWHQVDLYPYPASTSGITIGSMYTAQLAADEWFMPDVWSGLGIALSEAWRGQSGLTDVPILTLAANASLVTTSDDITVYLRGRILRGVRP